MKSHAVKSEDLFRRRLLATGYRNRRRMATAAAMLLAALMGYFAVIGENGLTAYKQKRMEDRQLAKRIESLKTENERLQAHVERLKSDPDAIEHEAREKLHYTRAGEVIYTLNDKSDSNQAASTGLSGTAAGNPATGPPAIR